MCASSKRARLEFSERLQSRLAEIEQTVLARVHAVSDLTARADPDYVEGLRAAVSSAIEYGLAGIAHGEEGATPTPTALLAQARLAARNGIPLDTVLRRYLAGYTLLGDFVIEEAQKEDSLDGPELKRILRAQAALFDRLLAAVSQEYTRESRSRAGSSEQQRAERVRRLLNGELIDTAEFSYDFAAEHLAVAAAGPGVPETIRTLAAALGRQLLLVPRSGGVVWAWLGGRHDFALDLVEQHLRENWPAQTSLAMGEPARGIDGWRLSHRQAVAALPIALRTREAFVRYGDVALLAATLADDLLATSLRELYLVPLTLERDGGGALKETLRAYFAAERNVSSTAAAIGVSRQTVVNRLRVIEERFDRPLSSCATEVDAALRLDELGYGKLSSPSSESGRARPTG